MMRNSTSPSMGDLHDRLTYLEERLKALDKFDAPLGPANGSEPHYGHDLGSVHNRMQSAADFLGQEFVQRYEQAQRDVQRPDNGFLPPGSGTNGSHSHAHSRSGRIGEGGGEWLSGLGGDDAGLSELNSLYAVVQDIKRDLSIMSSPPKPGLRPGSRHVSPPSEPSAPPPRLHTLPPYHPAALRSDPHAPLPAASSVHDPRAHHPLAFPPPHASPPPAYHHSQHAPPPQPLDHFPSPPPHAAHSFLLPEPEAYSSLPPHHPHPHPHQPLHAAPPHHHAYAPPPHLGRAPPAPPPPAPPPPHLGQAPAMAAPYSPEPRDARWDDSRYAEDQPEAPNLGPGDEVVGGGSPLVPKLNLGHLRAPQAAAPPEALSGLQAAGAHASPSVPLHAPPPPAAPPDSDRVVAVDEGEVELTPTPEEAPRVVQHHVQPYNAAPALYAARPPSPPPAPALPAPAEVPAPATLSGRGDGGGGEGGRATQAAPAVGVRMTLEEEYDSLLSTHAKRMQMEKTIKEDVADALRIPRTRIKVIALLRGSVVVHLNIEPSETAGGLVPDELADQLVAQFRDKGSKLRKAMSTRRVSDVQKCAPFDPPAQPSWVPPPSDTKPSPSSAATPAMTPLRAPAPSQGEGAFVTPPRVDDSDGELRGSISDRMKIFQQLEKGGSVPQPSASKPSGPHFSAPKAAVKAHVAREGDSWKRTDAPRRPSLSDHAPAPAPPQEPLPPAADPLSAFDAGGLAGLFDLAADAPTPRQDETPRMDPAGFTAPAEAREKGEGRGEGGGEGAEEEEEGASVLSARRFGVTLKRTPASSRTRDDDLTPRDDLDPSASALQDEPAPAFSLPLDLDQPAPSVAAPQEREGGGRFSLFDDALPQEPPAAAQQEEAAAEEEEAAATEDLVGNFFQDVYGGSAGTEPPQPMELVEPPAQPPLEGAPPPASVLGGDLLPPSGEEPPPSDPLVQEPPADGVLPSYAAEGMADALGVADALGGEGVLGGEGMGGAAAPEDGMAEGMEQAAEVEGGMEEQLNPSGALPVQPTPGEAASFSDMPKPEGEGEGEDEGEVRVGPAAVAEPDVGVEAVQGVEEVQQAGDSAALAVEAVPLLPPSIQQLFHQYPRRLSLDQIRMETRPLLDSSSAAGVVARTEGRGLGGIQIKYTSIFEDSDRLEQWRNLGGGLVLKWVWGLVQKAARGTLRGRDVELAVGGCSAEELHNELLKALAEGKRVGMNNAGLLRAVMESAKRGGKMDLALSLGWALFALTAATLCVRELLMWLAGCKALALRAEMEECLEAPQKRPLWEGLVLAGALALCVLGSALCLHWHLHGRRRAVVEAAGALMSVLYSKALRSKAFCSESLRDPEKAYATSLAKMLLVDTDAITKFESFRQLRVVGIGTCFVAAALMVREVELSTVGAGAVMLALLGLQYLLVRLSDGTWTKRFSEDSHARMAEVSDFFVRFRAIKEAGWEGKYAEGIQQAWVTELRECSWCLFSEGVGQALVLGAAGLTMAAVVTCVLYLEQRHVSPLELMLVLALAALLSVPLSIIPLSGKVLARRELALQRVLDFVLQPDREDASVHPTGGSSKHLACYASDCIFKWESPTGAKAFSLGSPANMLSLEVHKGELMALVGAGKEGKSSLLHALASRMPKVRGRLEVDGEMVLCSHDPMLLAGSVRQNVLFGLPLDEPMYACAMKCTGLDQRLGRRDQDVIGESSGQLALTEQDRVLLALARAVYQDADTYLLDGVMEVLDVEAAQTVWRECIFGQLKAKTVVVTAGEGAWFLPACNSACVLQAQDSIDEVRGHVTFRGSGREVAQWLQERGDRSASGSFLLRPQSDLRRTLVNPDPRWITPTTILPVDTAEAEAQSPPGILTWFLAEQATAARTWAALLLAILGQAVMAGAQAWTTQMYADADKNVLGVGSQEWLLSGLGPTANLIVLWVCALVAAPALLMVAHALVAQSSVDGSEVLHSKLVEAMRGGRYMDVVTGHKPLLAMDLLGPRIEAVLEGFTEWYLQALMHSLAAVILLLLVTVGTCTVGELNEGGAALAAWERESEVAVQRELVPLFALSFVLLFPLLVWVWARGGGAVRRVAQVAAAARGPVLALCVSTTEVLAQATESRAQQKLVATMQGLVDAYTRRRYALHGVQVWTGVGVAGVGALMVLALAVMLVLCGEAGLLLGLRGLGVAGLMLACALQAGWVLQWGVVCSQEAAAIFHSGIGSTRKIMQALFPPETAASSQELMGPTMLEGRWKSQVGGSVALQNVCVARSASLRAGLAHVNLMVHAGERLLVLGAEWSGLQTLPLAILRAVALREGTVTVGEVDVRKVGLEQLRRQVACVWRHPVLFSGSIAHNLDMTSQRTDAEKLAALRMVGLVPPSATAIPPTFLANIPNVSDCSIKQRQLVSTARALLRNPRILMLDELGATLDAPELENLDRSLALQQHMTVIHLSSQATRLATFPRVALMREERLVFNGTPLQLLALSDPWINSLLESYGPMATEALYSQCVVAASGEATPYALSGMATPVVQDLQQPLGQQPRNRPELSLQIPNTAVHFSHPAPPEQPAPDPSEVAKQAMRDVLLQGGISAESLDDPPPAVVELTASPATMDTLRGKREDDLFELVRTCISILHETLVLDEPLPAAQPLQSIRDSLFAQRANPEVVEEMLLQCADDNIHSDALYREPMLAFVPTVAAVMVHLLHALPRRLISPPLLAELRHNLVSYRATPDKVAALSGVVQAQLDAEGQYLELFVQVVWLAFHVCHAAPPQSPPALAALLGPFLVAGSGQDGQLVREEAEVVEFFIQRYDALLEGQVTYGDDGAPEEQTPAPYQAPPLQSLQPKPDPPPQPLVEPPQPAPPQPAPPQAGGAEAGPGQAEQLQQLQQQLAAQGYTPEQQQHYLHQYLAQLQPPAPPPPAQPAPPPVIEAPHLEPPPPHAASPPHAAQPPPAAPPPPLQEQPAAAPAPEPPVEHAPPPPEEPPEPAPEPLQPSNPPPGLGLHEVVLDAGEMERRLGIGADVNERNEELLTVLMVAACSGRPDLVGFLINAGAEIGAVDNQGLNALFLALLCREPDGDYLQVLQLLLAAAHAQQQPLVRSVTANGDNVFHFLATVLETPEMVPPVAADLVKALVDAGADLRMVNEDNLTPEQIAQQNENLSLALLLDPLAYKPPKPGDVTHISSPPLSPTLIAQKLQDGKGVMGALMEGYLHYVDRKKKDFVPAYYALVPMMNDKHGTGHGNFAYMLKAAEDLEKALKGEWFEAINIEKAEAKLLTGTVFSIKTSPEVSKSRTHRLSSDNLNQLRDWFEALEVVPANVNVIWTDKDGAELSRDRDPL